MLIELPNGQWTDPEQVVGVFPLLDDAHGPRVRIDLRDRACALIRFTSIDEAAVWAGEFARGVNAAFLRHHSSAAEQERVVDMLRTCIAELRALSADDDPPAG